ncbi:Nramp family divalent metal transporter [Leifsonia sp. NPDC058248]|uniref:Nramp family divalent metal transporter n=1 Tax=Leifsonia sp. NPDC058248 TaxID=3346402 RepID=UPI0036DB4F7C
MAVAVEHHKAGTRARLLLLLGPAFVAAIAYVDPGNVAANLTAGARYGYLLVWVLVAANAIAVFIQYQSAKLGIVTGSSLPELLGSRLGTGTRRAFWVQAELVAAATDLAEVIGGAIALNLLFGLPLPVGGLIVGLVAIGILAIQSRRGQRPFEMVILGLLGVISIGFLAGLFVSPVDWRAAVGGLVPRFDGAPTVLLAASMLGATVMPHAIYLHSALSRDRHGKAATTPTGINRLLRATKIDVLAALALAGAVNIAMLLLAAASLGGASGTDTIAGAHAAISEALGPVIGVVFAVGLLASGLASTSVGSYAGATIMAGLLKMRIPLLTRRVVTLIPALVILAVGVEPTWALVISQVFLSLGIPFAMIPLLRLTGSRAVMGDRVDGRWMRVLGFVIATLVVVLNVALVVLTVSGWAGG